uniref:PKD domain-containing protein n=1 Tax=Pavo cristatus TaxID=9049 RepID=A0A8C9FIU6_PAVCR
MELSSGIEGNINHSYQPSSLIQLSLLQGDLQRTNIQLDFGDGIAVSYANFSPVEDGIRHVYKSAGIFQVTAYAENSLGSDTAVLFLHVICPVEHVHLSVPFVAIRNKDVNITAVVWPSQAGTLTYFWWFGNSTKPLITLESSISYVFSEEGMNTVTVQVAAGNTLIQDTKEIAVHEYFQSQLLSFSPNLDYHNPDIPEWRQDIGKVIRRALVTGIPDEQILVAVFPGLPTSAELFVLPRKNTTERRKSSEADLEQVRKKGFTDHLFPSTGHSSSAMLMLLSVVFVGLAVFLIYKFKRNPPPALPHQCSENSRRAQKSSCFLLQQICLNHRPENGGSLCAHPVKKHD